MKTIAELERRKIELRKEKADLIKSFESKIQGFNDEIGIAEEMIQRKLKGLDEDLIIHAEHIISVGGLYAKAGDDRESALSVAIKQILDGGGTLFNEYIGTKSYAHWHGQRISCTYGMGPSHGSVIFQIGLHNPVRARDPKILTEEEINACLYYLRNLTTIQEAREAAKKESGK